MPFINFKLKKEEMFTDNISDSGRNTKLFVIGHILSVEVQKYRV